MNPSRCILRAALVGLVLSLATAVAHAQPYPAKPIRMLSQFPAGGPIDTLTRQIGAEVTRDFGQPFLIENRPGGGGIISMDACAKAVPDGYTVCLVDRSIPLLPFMHSKLPFDIERDYVPVTNMVYTVLALVAHPSAGASNLQELIAVARSKPGGLTYGSLGSGTMANLLMEWLKKQNGINVTHVPYKGPPELIRAVLSGEVHLTYLGVGGFVQFHKAGKLKIIGVSGDKRSPVVPDVPTLVEQGLTGMDARVWFGLFAPAGTPREAVDKVQKEVAKILTAPAFVEKNLVQQAFDPIASTPEEFARSLKADRESGAELIRISGAKLE
jgi:tripartite-type tricarboxylate transporter receptor subunit TctC